jgi:hypothetical protein
VAEHLLASGFAALLIDRIILIESGSIFSLLETLAAIVEMWQGQSASAALEELAGEERLVAALEEVERSFDGELAEIARHILSVLGADD